MALVLIATSAAADANSYATIEEGDDYHSRRLFSDDWTNAATDIKTAALVWSTMQLDALYQWEGDPWSIEQALRFPRYGVYTRDGLLIDAQTIPQALKDATCEFARILIGKDRTNELGTEGLRSLTVGPIKLDFDKLDRIEVVPTSVDDLIRHLGTYTTAKSSVVKLCRA